MAASALSAARKIPFLAAQHLEGHALTATLTDRTSFPYLLLLVSGGHTAAAHGTRRRATITQLGTTIDDAARRSFRQDRQAPWSALPAAPNVERPARTAMPSAFTLPRPMKAQPGCDFSFSGLKTALRRPSRSSTPADQQSARRSLRLLPAHGRRRARGSLRPCAPHGAVADLGRGRRHHRQSLSAGPPRRGRPPAWRLVAPPVKLCTDNGAMIAWAGIERLRLGLTDGLDFKPRPRWPLDSTAAVRV